MDENYGHLLGALGNQRKKTEQALHIFILTSSFNSDKSRKSFVIIYFIIRRS